MAAVSGGVCCVCVKIDLWVLAIVAAKQNETPPLPFSILALFSPIHTPAMDSDSSYSDLTHRYSPPTPVSQSTAFHYRGHQQSTRNNNNASHGSPSHHLPGVSDLANIKADLERVLTRAETRLRHLRKDFGHLDKNVKVRETGGKRE